MYDSRYKPPKKRSSLRIRAGWVIYNILRSFLWILRHGSYVSPPAAAGRARKGRPVRAEEFGTVVFAHRTPLYRPLKDTDREMQENKVHNLRLALERMEGIVIPPGQVFSYWKLIGPPLRYRGFKKGMVLVNGKVESRTGGGLCQLSNLLYWMTLHTPLTVTERFRHSYDVFPDASRTQPFGSGATCVYKYRDLQIRNAYVEPFRLSLAIREDHLEGAWLCRKPTELTYEVYEKKHWITQGGAGTYIRNNILHRRCYSRGDLAADEYVTENHALMMYSPLLNEPASFAGGQG